MRQAPDVILVGELRDPDTVQMALRAADTGHQVLATIHASNAAQTIERLLAMVPGPLPADRPRAARRVAGRRRSRQRLTNDKAGERRPVVEVFRGDSVVAKYILENRINDIADYIPPASAGCRRSTSTCSTSTTRASSAARRPWPSPRTPRRWRWRCGCRGGS